MARGVVEESSKSIEGGQSERNLMINLIIDRIRLMRRCHASLSSM